MYNRDSYKRRTLAFDAVYAYHMKAQATEHLWVDDLWFEEVYQLSTRANIPMKEFEIVKIKDKFAIVDVPAFYCAGQRNSCYAIICDDIANPLIESQRIYLDQVPNFNGVYHPVQHTKYRYCIDEKQDIVILLYITAEQTVTEGYGYENIDGNIGSYMIFSNLDFLELGLKKHYDFTLFIDTQMPLKEIKKLAVVEHSESEQKWDVTWGKIISYMKSNMHDIKVSGTI
jgi:effector-binding domain-containing protein